MKNTIKLKKLLQEQRDGDSNNNGYPDSTESPAGAPFTTTADYLDADDVAMLEKIASGAQLDIADYMSIDALYKYGYVDAHGQLTPKGVAAVRTGIQPNAESSL